jgi:hypothetical protein
MSVSVKPSVQPAHYAELEGALVLFAARPSAAMEEVGKELRPNGAALRLG